MHELSIVASLFEIIEEKAQEKGSTKIISVKLQIGKLSGVVPEFLITAFDMYKKDTIAQDAELEIEEVEHIEVADSDGPGNCVMIRVCDGSRTTVFTAFGMRGKPSQDVVGEVVNLAKDFLASGAAIDRFLADQLLIYMAIAKSGCYTTNELSSHLLTNMETIKRFLPVDFSVQRQKEIYRISCRSA